jgi:PIN domain nuclease of toxin-antitoxin system
MARHVVVLDTSALVYWTLDPHRLSQNAAEAIAAADAILVSSISIWELAIKVRRGRLTIPTTIRSYTDALKRAERVDIVAVDEGCWIDSVELDWGHRDPADRTIVALAARHRCPLITSDRQMRQFYERAVW